MLNTAMTNSDFNAAVAKMGIRKNNTIAVGGFVIEKWGADRFKLTKNGRQMSVAPLAYITKLLKDNGAVR